MKRLIAIACFFLALSAISAAERIESPFFRLNLGEEWKVSRSLTGLWVARRTDPFPLTLTLAYSRLKTSPELFLQGTLAVWRTQGEVEVRRLGQGAECLIRPADEGDPIFKWLELTQDHALVASFTFPVKHTDEAIAMALPIARQIESKVAVFEPETLRRTVQEALGDHRNDAEELANSDEVRRQMTSFRQDWEWFFAQAPDPLYTAYLAYLEARYDAAYVVAFGKEMGMPDSLLQTRLEAVKNRRAEVLRQLEQS